MINSALNYYISRKKPLITLGKRDKIPNIKNWENANIPYDTIISAYNRGYNVGMRLSPADIVVDVDPRNFPENVNSLVLLENRIGVQLSKIAPTVRTGGGGYHFYLQKPEDFPISETLDDFPGIEFKSAGRQVVCAGSIHPLTGKKYQFVDNGITEPPIIPQLLNIIHRGTVESPTVDEIIRNDQLADLLSQLPVTDFSSNDRWFPIMCACHHATGGQGIDEFVTWSLKDPKYAQCEHDIRKRWDSLGGKEINYTVRTLYHAVLSYGGSVNRIVHDFDGMADSPTGHDSTSASALGGDSASAVTDGIALKLASALSDTSSNEDVLRAIKASIQADAIEQVRAQKIIMKTANLTRSDLNKIIATVKEKIIEDLGRKLADSTLKNRFCNGTTVIMNSNGQFWWYDGKRWKPVIKEYIGKMVTMELDSLRAKNADIEIKENTIVSDAVSIIGRLTSTNEDVLRLRQKPHSVLNCLNGELWMDNVESGTVELRPHNPLSYLIMVTNVEYNPSATCPRHEKALRETFANYPDCEDIIRHFYEFIGYILHPDKRPAHWFLLRGPGSDGKTTQMKIISALLGDAVVPDSIERYRTGAFADSHSTSDLVGKLLIYDDDLNKNTVLPDGTLKKLSEDGELTANPKGYAPFKFVKVCTVVMCCNGLPRTKDVSRGFRRRAMVIPFDRGFTPDEMDNNLADYIIRNELSGVLNKAIEGLIRLKRRGYFQEPESCLNAKHLWLDSANPVASFVRDKVITTDNPKDKITLPEMYSAFLSYCTDQNYSRVPSKSEFAATAEELGIKYEKQSTHSKRYVGIQIAATDDFSDAG